MTIEQTVERTVGETIDLARYQRVFRGMTPQSGKKLIEKTGVNMEELLGRSDNERQAFLAKQDTGTADYEHRVDPLLGWKRSLHSTIISRDRALRPISRRAQADKVDARPCIFCEADHVNRTGVGYDAPVPILSKAVTSESQSNTFDNIFPFLVPHYVTTFPMDHADLTRRPRFDELTQECYESFLETGKQLWHRIAQYGGCGGMADFINLGANGGASVVHLHAQRGGIPYGTRSLMEQEAEAYAGMSVNVTTYDALFDSLRKAGLVIQEDDQVISYAAFAPRFTDEVHVTLKNPCSNYGQFNGGAQQGVASALANATTGLAKARNVQNANIITFQTGFSNEHPHYRMHWRICPREAVPASMEWNNVHIISAYPEQTAKTLQAYAVRSDT